MPSIEGYKGSKMPNMIYQAPTGLRRSARFSNKIKQKYVVDGTDR